MPEILKGHVTRIVSPGPGQLVFFRRLLSSCHLAHIVRTQNVSSEISCHKKQTMSSFVSELEVYSVHLCLSACNPHLLRIGILLWCLKALKPRPAPIQVKLPYLIMVLLVYDFCIVARSQVCLKNRDRIHTSLSRTILSFVLISVRILISIQVRLWNWNSEVSCTQQALVLRASSLIRLLAPLCANYTLHFVFLVTIQTLRLPVLEGC